MGGGDKLLSNQSFLHVIKEAVLKVHFVMLSVASTKLTRRVSILFYLRKRPFSTLRVTTGTLGRRYAHMKCVIWLCLDSLFFHSLQLFDLKDHGYFRIDLHLACGDRNTFRACHTAAPAQTVTVVGLGVT